MAVHGRHYKRRKLGLFRTAALVVLIMALVGAGVCGVSTWQMQGAFRKTEVALDAMDEAIDTGDYAAAAVHARESVEGIEDLERELEGPQWNLVALMPYLGEDVRFARELVSVAHELVGDAIAPVLGEVAQASDNFDFSTILTDGLDSATSLLNAAVDAREHVNACDRRMGELGDSHFAVLNDFAGDLRSTISDVQGIFERFDAGFGLANMVTDLFN